ncbi:uncharacterized protein LOC134830715 [Culicoides brevitarsis]|uniref:uncharacterized protein LOC134830715 n=1 Tax=Culicoides brevitarsis TaxID=469753 RepID=UPI00307B4362
MMDDDGTSNRFKVLNEYCLRDILKFFHPHELLLLLEVPHLGTVVNDLRKKYPDFQFLHEIDDVKWDMENFRDALTFMGPNLKSVTLDSERLFDMSLAVIFFLLDQLCPKLESLELRGFSIEFKQTSFEFSRMTKRLRSISLIGGVYRDNIGRCLGSSSQLEDLSMKDCIKYDEFLTHFRNLKSISLVRIDYLQSEDFIEILEQNLTLKKIECIQKKCIDDDVINFIVAKLKNVEDLRFQVDSDIKINLLGKLPNLKKLYLDFHPSRRQSTKMLSLLEKLRDKNNIEELHLLNFDLSEHIDSLSELTTLKILEINYDLPYSEMKKLQNLHRLECVAFNNAEFSSSALLEFMTNMKNLKKINIPSFHIHENFAFLDRLMARLEAFKRPKKLEIGTYFYEELITQPEFRQLLDENRHILSFHKIEADI